MANLALNVTIKDLNLAVAKPAFLRKCPMPQIEDPDNPGEIIDAYNTDREWVEAWLRMKLLRAINRGINLQAQDLVERLTEDIFLIGI